MASGAVGNPYIQHSKRRGSWQRSAQQDLGYIFIHPSRSSASFALDTREVFLYTIFFLSSKADCVIRLGALAPVASVTLVRTLSFSIYQNAKYKCSAAIGRATGDDEPLVVVNRPGSTPTPQTIACFAAAGATAGFFVSLVACKYLLSSDFLVLITKTGPFEFTKQASQISVLMANSNMSSMDEPIRQSNEQKGTLTTAKNIIKNRGYAGLYSGFRLHCCECNLLSSGCRSLN